MQLVAISTVKNESDIIEAFVRHTATVCDAHVILDHASTDDTRGILEELEREGLALRVVTDSDPTSDQSGRLTRLMRLAVAEEDADWVIPLDADEFIDVSAEGMRHALTGIEQPVQVLWRSYVPSADDSPDDLNPVTRIQHRLVAEGFPWKKVLVPRAVARDAQLAPGSHDVEEADPHGERRLLGKVALGHFPIRSPEQYATRSRWQTCSGQRGATVGAWDSTIASRSDALPPAGPISPAPMPRMPRATRCHPMSISHRS